MDNTKQCTKCGEHKTLDCFSKVRDKKYPDKFWYMGACKPCRVVNSQKWAAENREYKQAYNREYTRKWARENPKEYALIQKRKKLKHRYNITLDDFNDMKEEQDNTCRICNTLFDNTTVACVDHCHDTGKVRGLLCSPCNKGLGNFKDNVDNLGKAIDYLLTSNKDT